MTPYKFYVDLKNGKRLFFDDESVLCVYFTVHIKEIDRVVRIENDTTAF